MLWHWQPVAISRMMLSAILPNPPSVVLPATTSANHSVSHAWQTSSFLNSVLDLESWFGLSKPVYGGPCRHCTVFSLIRMSVLCFSTFPAALKCFTLCLYRLWHLPRFISGYYTDVKKKTFNAFMLQARARVSVCMSVCSADELRLCGYC